MLKRRGGEGVHACTRGGVGRGRMLKRRGVEWQGVAGRGGEGVQTCAYELEWACSRSEEGRGGEGRSGDGAAGPAVHLRA